MFVVGARKCPECAHPLPHPPLSLPDDSIRFGRASFSVRCPTCENDSPVLRPDVAAVECEACGDSIPLDPQGITRVLRFAHDVADRPPGGSSEGRRDFGIALDVRRGHPCCEACIRPLRVRAPQDPPGPFALVCDGCGAVRESWSAERATAAHPKLLGVLPATATARDTQGRTLAWSSRRKGSVTVTALVCPACAAALPAPDGDTGLATCRYCKTISLVRAEAPQRPESPPGHVWLAFDGHGPSAERKAHRDAARAHPKARSPKQATAATEATTARDTATAQQAPSAPDAPDGAQTPAPSSGGALWIPVLAVFVVISVVALAALTR